MNDWFTVEEIDGKTYAISEYKNPQQVHSFLVIGEEYAAMIDTGMGIANIKEITDGLTRLPVKVITTHAHFDHIAGHGYYDEIYVHKYEADWLRHGAPMSLDDIKAYILEDPENMPLPEGYDIEGYSIFTGEPTGVLDDGDVIVLGGRDLSVIHTPGHSPGHICLLEKKTGYLFCGDLIYNAELYACFPYSDPALYGRSLEKISFMKEVKRLLPGHCDLNIGLDLLRDAAIEFKNLEMDGLLKLGSGTYKYDNFEIVL